MYSQAIAPTIKPNRAHFNMGSRHATTIDFDYLYPVFWEEVLPGDTFTMDTDMFGRFATLLHPLMDNCYLDLHYFWAPPIVTGKRISRQNLFPEYWI